METALSVAGQRQAPFFFKPSSIDEAWRLSNIIAKSDLAPKDFKGKPENTFLAMQMGAELGLSPMQAIQNISVINGRPCVWGDAALALVYASQKLESLSEKIEGEGERKRAVCVVRRVGGDEVIRSFSVVDAKLAGLFGKTGPWTQYPDRMLQMRARGFALRDAFPDVLRGLNVAEEVADYSDAEEVKSQPVTQKTSHQTVAQKTELQKTQANEVENEKPLQGSGQSFLIKKSPVDGKTYITIDANTEVFSRAILDRFGFVKSKDLFFAPYSADTVEDLLSIEEMKKAITEVSGPKAAAKNEGADPKNDSPENNDQITSDMRIEYELENEQGGI